MSAQNPVCEQGCMDREREPACITKCCVPHITYIHYEGCDAIAILYFFFSGFISLYICCIWEPTLKPGCGVVALVGAPMAAMPMQMQPGMQQMQPGMQQQQPGMQQQQPGMYQQ